MGTKRKECLAVGLFLFLACGSVAALIVTQGILGVPQEVIVEFISSYIAPIFAWFFGLLFSGLAILGAIYIIGAAVLPEDML